MAPEDADIRPETYALEALIRKTLARTRPRVGGPATDALLFLGNRHHAFPAVVVQDPVLEPVDKLVWMVICQAGQVSGVRPDFPSYTDIARLANVSSTSTVSRAIAILRATRWLSLCARSRSSNGRYAGNVYALHDEPLPLSDALHLDPGYMAFLQDATKHHHARVRRVVAAVFASLDADIRGGRDVVAPESPIERRIEAAQAIQRDEGRRYFSFSADVLVRLSNSGGGSNQDQKSKAENRRCRNSKAVRGSSKDINKTTTTDPDLWDPARVSATLDGLFVPARLKDNQRALAARYLATIPVEQRQSVLDELAGRLEAEKRGATPIYDELRYLHRLCVRVKRGHFAANLALKVQDERERRRLETERAREDATAREPTPEAPATRARGESAIAEMRKRLGLRS